MFGNMKKIWKIMKREIECDTIDSDNYFLYNFKEC